MEAEQLAEWLDRLTFADLTTDEVTARVIDAVAEWGAAQGWRVYRRAPSVVTLPPPMERQHSVLDVACARPDGPPIVVEVDHTDRRRTVDKLLAEAAGRAHRDLGAVGHRRRSSRRRCRCRWPRFEVTRRSGRRFARAHDLAPPAHSAGFGAAEEMPMPFGETP